MVREPTDRSSPIGPGDVHLAAHRFQGVRLTVARDLRALTRAELAERVFKTPSAISQFEGGRSRPDGRTLAALSLVLGMPVGFFARTDCRALALDGCHFRSLRSASQRERRRLLAIGTLICELFEALEEHMDFPPEQVSAVARATMSADDIEACAIEVRRAWGLGQGPIPNVVKLLQSKGVVPCMVPPTCRDVDAFSAWHVGRPLVFLVGDQQGTRMRFDAAHELGHLVMHADVNPGGHEVERDAHRFAGAFLIPRDQFVAEWPRWLNWEQIFELKRRWGISASALVRRSYDLGLLSEPSYRRANIRLRQDASIDPHEPAPEYPTILQKSVALLQEDSALEQFAEAQGLRAKDLLHLVNGELPEEGTLAPMEANPQLSLLGDTARRGS
jgi:Zn-dependent peptidase ImmA (M78 family)/transcriptional regulator with XRE-family HTH domain